MKSRLQPLPKKGGTSAPKGVDDGRPTVVSAAAPGGKALIQPRRMALKFDTSTLIIEYKDLASGKLRHRSFHIDTNRFRDADACVEKLWAKLTKVVVPGSIPEEQLHGLVDKLWHNGAEHSPDLDELEAETNAFMERHRRSGEIAGAGGLKPDSLNRTAGGDQVPAKKILNALPLPRKIQATRENAQQAADELSLEGYVLKGKDRGQQTKDAPEDSPLAASPSEPPRPKTEHQALPQPLVLIVETSKDLVSERKSPAQKVLSPGAESVPSEIAEYVSDFEDLEESPGKENSVKRFDSESPEGDLADARRDGESSFDHKKRLEGDDVDLNNVDQEELDEYKRLMEVNFQKHAILPGDPRYQHDVQVEFSDPEEDCGWDEEDDSGDEDSDPFLP